MNLMKERAMKYQAKPKVINIDLTRQSAKTAGNAACKIDLKKHINLNPGSFRVKEIDLGSLPKESNRNIETTNKISVPHFPSPYKCTGRLSAIQTKTGKLEVYSVNESNLKPVDSKIKDTLNLRSANCRTKDLFQNVSTAANHHDSANFMENLVSLHSLDANRNCSNTLYHSESSESVLNKPNRFLHLQHLNPSTAELSHPLYRTGDIIISNLVHDNCTSIPTGVASLNKINKQLNISQTLKNFKQLTSLENPCSNQNTYDSHVNRLTKNETQLKNSISASSVIYTKPLYDRNSIKDNHSSINTNYDSNGFSKTSHSTQKFLSNTSTENTVQQARMRYFSPAVVQVKWSKSEEGGIIDLNMDRNKNLKSKMRNQLLQSKKGQKSIILIQVTFRNFREKKLQRKLVNLIIRIQSVQRGYATRKKFAVQLQVLLCLGCLMRRLKSKVNMKTFNMLYAHKYNTKSYTAKIMRIKSSHIKQILSYSIKLDISKASSKIIHIINASNYKFQLFAYSALLKFSILKNAKKRAASSYQICQAGEFKYDSNSKAPIMKYIIQKFSMIVAMSLRVLKASAFNHLKSYAPKPLIKSCSSLLIEQESSFIINCQADENSASDNNAHTKVKPNLRSNNFQPRYKKTNLISKEVEISLKNHPKLKTELTILNAEKFSCSGIEHCRVFDEVNDKRFLIDSKLNNSAVIKETVLELNYSALPRIFRSLKTETLNEPEYDCQFTKCQSLKIMKPALAYMIMKLRILFTAFPFKRIASDCDNTRTQNLSVILGSEIRSNISATPIKNISSFRLFRKNSLITNKNRLGGSLAQYNTKATHTKQKSQLEENLSFVNRFNVSLNTKDPDQKVGCIESYITLSKEIKQKSLLASILLRKEYYAVFRLEQKFISWKNAFILESKPHLKSALVKFKENKDKRSKLLDLSQLSGLKSMSESALVLSNYNRNGSKSVISNSYFKKQLTVSELDAELNDDFEKPRFIFTNLIENEISCCDKKDGIIPKNQFNKKEVKYSSFAQYCRSIQTKYLTKVMKLLVFEKRLKSALTKITFANHFEESVKQSLLCSNINDDEYIDDLYLSYVLIIQQAFRTHITQKYALKYSKLLNKLNVLKQRLALYDRSILKRKLLQWRRKSLMTMLKTNVDIIQANYLNFRVTKIKLMRNKALLNIRNLFMDGFIYSRLKPAISSLNFELKFGRLKLTLWRQALNFNCINK